MSPLTDLPAAGDSPHPLDEAGVFDLPIPYMARTRAYYLALGYDNPYRWAHAPGVPAQIPFTPWGGEERAITLITTAAPYEPAKGDQGPDAPHNARAKFYQVYSGATDADHDVRITHVAIDRTHGVRTDPGAWFPLPGLRTLAAAGHIRLAPRFHGVPTQRSQRHTLEVDGPEVLRRCQEDGVGAAVLVPNCPICHQSLALVARILEAAGIATVLMGCARDVVEYCGVPRFLFSDFPLGHSAGKPHDPASQANTLALALALLRTAVAPRTTVQSPERWAADPAWKLDYANPRRLTPAALERLRAEAEAARLTARAIRQADLSTEAAP